MNFPESPKKISPYAKPFKSIFCDFKLNQRLKTSFQIGED